MRLPGQGKPLPPDCPFKGQWLLENVLFLYEPDAANGGGGNSPDLSRVFQRADGDWCIGFNSEVIANRLGMAAAHLFDANRSGDMTITIHDAPGCVGAGGARRYVFAIGEASAGLVLGATS